MNLYVHYTITKSTSSEIVSTFKPDTILQGIGVKFKWFFDKQTPG